ncbi:hypothetical protein Dimus_030445 [Dionaea muscipula]
MRGSLGARVIGGTESAFVVETWSSPGFECPLGVSCVMLFYFDTLILKLLEGRISVFKDDNIDMVGHQVAAGVPVLVFVMLFILCLIKWQ